MTTSLVHVEIDRLLESLSGELTSHSRVVDALLDVRRATADTQIVALVDDALRNIPGKNVAETSWLRARLEYVSLMSEMNSILREDTTAV